MTEFILMNKLSELVNVLSTSHYDDDFVDRLNYRTTSIVLLSTAIFIFSKVKFIFNLILFFYC